MENNNGNNGNNGRGSGAGFIIAGLICGCLALILWQVSCMFD